MVSTAMSDVATPLPNDPALLKAMIAALQAENRKISATLRAHDLLIQTLRGDRPVKALWRRYGDAGYAAVAA
jgi:hypothetical protein